MEGEGLARLTEPVGPRDHAQGPTTAPVTLVEYGDYECPFCSTAHPIIQELQERLGDRLQYVYRHFPIRTSHPRAQIAAEAAEAAAAQGKFWEMHDLLFDTEEELTDARLLQFAEELDLALERFESELHENVYADRVREDFFSGVRSGVNGTPTFFINDVRYDGPWDLESLLEAIERPLGVQVRILAQEFMQLAASGGIVLLIAAIVALLWANSPWAESYFQFWETHLDFTLGGRALSESLLEWVNDGLMVVFFVVVGLEIKREVQTGELASPRKAALPIAGAVGGMVFPALFYVLFNAGGPGAPGWGIPMATDIAFTLGILTVMGGRVPLSLKVFFTALAIADDLGAVLVIAIFYTSEISWLALGVGALFLIALFALNSSRVYSPLPYWILGIGLWLAFLESGVHPTIAGVLLAMTIPTRSPPDTRAMLAQCVTVLDDYESLTEEPAAVESQRQAAARTLETIADRMQSPAQRLERDLNPWATYLILPLFALANAGLDLGAGVSTAALGTISLGIVLGLVIGKPLGIALVSWLAVRVGLAEMPAGVSWPQLISASALAGIGFTMSLFIAGAAFEDPATLAAAKIGILVASVLAGGIGFLALSLTSPRYDRSTAAEVAVEPA